MLPNSIPVGYGKSKIKIESWTSGVLVKNIVKVTMGYTHYYYQDKPFTQNEWEKIAVDTMKALEYCEDNGIRLVYECDNPKQSEVSDTLIRFNGLASEGHETFVLEKEPDPTFDDSEGKKVAFNFCKTARKPYDLAVGLVLLIAKKHAPNSIRVNSDGTWDKDEIDEDWKDIRKAYEQIFGEKPECPFSKEE